MIVTENMTINGKTFIRTYSDSGYMIERNGVQYSEAIDPAEMGRTYTETGITYTETDELVEGMTEMEQKARAFDILMGVSE